MPITITKPTVQPYIQGKPNNILPFRQGDKTGRGGGNNGPVDPPNGGGGDDGSSNYCRESYENEMRKLFTMQLSIENDLKMERATPSVGGVYKTAAKNKILDCIQNLQTLLFNCENDPYLTAYRKARIKDKIKDLEEDFENLNKKSITRQNPKYKTLSVASRGAASVKLPQHNDVNWTNWVLKGAESNASKISHFGDKKLNEAQQWLDKHNIDIRDLYNKSNDSLKLMGIPAFIIALLPLLALAL